MVSLLIALALAARPRRPQVDMGYGFPSGKSLTGRSWDPFIAGTHHPPTINQASGTRYIDTQRNDRTPPAPDNRTHDTSQRKRPPAVGRCHARPRRAPPQNATGWLAIVPVRKRGRCWRASCYVQGREAPPRPPYAQSAVVLLAHAALAVVARTSRT